jgi:integrase/recombinase XerD
MVAWFGAKSELKALGDIGRGEMMEYAGSLLTAKGATGKPWTAMTRNRHLSTVRSFFKFLTKSGVLLANPATSLEMFKAERKLPAVPSVDDILKLLAAIDITTHRGLRDRAATEILYGSGLRISELLALDLYDVDFLEGLLHVRHGKGDKARLVPMVPETMKALLAYLEVARPRRRCSCRSWDTV